MSVEVSLTGTSFYSVGEGDEDEKTILHPDNTRFVHPCL